MTRDALAAGFGRFAAGLALFALALLVRASPWREVLGEERLLPIGSDAFYHLRRIVFAVFEHPAFLEFDRYINFPDGAKPIWTPLFDASIAALLRPWVPPLEQGGQSAVESLAVWVPPLLGAGCVVATWWLASRHYGARAGVVAGIVLALLSGHFWYSQIGFVDHHAAVALLATLLLASALALVDAQQQGARGRVAAWAVGAGVLAALCLLLWPGSLLHVGLVELVLLGFLLSQSDAARARSLAAALAGGYVLALICVAHAGLSNRWPQWGAFSPVVLSAFQPWLFAAGAIVTAGCAACWRVPAFGATRSRRALVFAGCGAAVAAASGLLAPELVEGAGDVWRWLAKQESFQSRVAESRPLFVDRGRFDATIALARLSPFVFAFPLAAGWICWRHRRRRELARTVMVVLWAGGLLAVTLVQKRFFNTASVGLTLVLSASFVELWGIAGGRPWRAMLWLALALSLLPVTTPYARFAANEWRAWRGERIEVTGQFGAIRSAVETAEWLRTTTPETRGWLRTEEVPEYGVLAPWHLGHAIEYVGRRPTVVDNFGDDLGAEGFAFADRFYHAPEAEVADAAARLGVRYVVAQRSAAFLAEPAAPGVLAHSLFRLDGSRSGDEDPAIPALDRHRLVFESRGLRFMDAEAEAVYKVFELVPGAVITGRAGPGAVVELRLGVFTNRGRRFFYETEARVGDDGAYRARVPYANSGGPESIHVAPLYRLKCGDEVRGVAVSEAAVRAGDTVRAPALCLETP